MVPDDVLLFQRILASSSQFDGDGFWKIIDVEARSVVGNQFLDGSDATSFPVRYSQFGGIAVFAGGMISGGGKVLVLFTRCCNGRGSGFMMNMRSPCVHIMLEIS